jgi:hypothetical protein
VTSCGIELDEIGWPQELYQLAVPAEFVLAAQIQIWLPTLRGFSSRAREMLTLVDALQNSIANVFRPEALSQPVTESAVYVEELLRLAALQQFDIAKHVLSVNADVLGAFFYDPSEGGGGYRRNYKTRIALYWGVLGLIAARLEVPVESLTAKVLAHELAHAYTHLGFDRDGRRWTGQGFAKSDHNVKEALAQYYTARCLERISERFPGPYDAYLKLLPYQPEAYQKHVVWLDKSSPELVGAMLAALRRNGAIKYEDFCDRLSIHKSP